MDAFLLKCLDEIEQVETRFLVWGLVDFAFQEQDLLCVIDPLFDEALDRGLEGFSSTKKVVDALKDRSLIHPFIIGGKECYRSRMAETVRLSSRLRQLFPKHEGRSGWQQAPTLVADYRFIRRKRRFPKRDLSVAQILEECQGVNCSQTQLQFLSTLCDRSGINFKLAGFQSKATTRILEGLNKRYDRGTIVCAGTGSGKTLSFYLSALTHIANLLSQSVTHKYWVKVLAIYPRNELLKDQFSEIYAEARRLDDLLASKKRRKIMIGAFFGPTPFDCKAVTNNANGWNRVSGGYACEYLRCPANECSGRLVWSDVNLKAEREQVTCSTCGHIIYDDEILLTRRRLMKTPPDILFTTTEMLNQRMSDSWSRHLFGLGPRAYKKPDLVLLDEVHTYTGTHGAQVAYLLRRWRSLVDHKVSFVGLSATLREASQFFSTLIGCKEWFVEEVSPRYDEMTASGAEYMLALRGDPVSRRSLMSTTIQAAMLANRCLDPRGKDVSKGAFGSKTFLFTDDIDVTNRLYFNLLDAEGRDSWGNIDNNNHPNGGLAYLRKEDGSDLIRYQHGQDWRLCGQIGHELDQRLKVGRTSSQDVGVDLSADLIVATSSLEVGFNDPDVGTVLQHKAPRDPAQFLQRKGRAGRTRTMRPWTMVSLSDYGRDRLAYQGYDVLFDPELPPRQLAINNRYVQRMQAVYALIDYLGMRLQSLKDRGSVWTELSAPLKFSETLTTNTRRQTLISELTNLLQSSPALDDLSAFLSDKLKVDELTLLSLLWEFPRPLLTAVIPTALRRVASNWLGSEPFTYNSPLPDFIPGNLFSDLNLPEVIVEIPPQEGFDSKRPPVMPVLQAMKEFAPGRVSRRFGVAHKFVRHWLVSEFEKDKTDQVVDLQTVAETYDLGEYHYSDSDGDHSIHVYRPQIIRPTVPSENVLDSSNAFHQWHTQIVPPGMNEHLDVPRNSGWDAVVKSISFYMHNHRVPVELRRFSLGTSASIAFKDGSRQETSFTFAMEDEQVGVGFSLTVDAIAFEITVPEDLWVDSSGHVSEKWRSLRTTRYFDLAWRGERLTSIVNPFARDWVARVFLSALTCDAIHTEKSLKDVCSDLVSTTENLKFEQVLETIFQSTANEVADEGDNPLRQEILDHLKCADVRKELTKLASCLWEPIDTSWQTWLHDVYTSTMSSALFRAVENLCPDLNTEDLLVDVEHNRDCNGAICDKVWISENTTGGCGLIESLIQRIGADPRQYFNLVEAALDSAEFELIDNQLTRLLELTCDDTSMVHSAIQAFREAGTLRETEQAFTALRQKMSDEGFVQFHSFVVSLNNRILRSGSNEGSDRLLHDIMVTWQSQETRLGIEVDARIVAYALSQYLKVEDVLQIELGEVVAGQILQWRFNSIYGLLWPRGRTVRQANLSLYNPFCDYANTERLLVKDRLFTVAPIIDVSIDGWREQCLLKLQANGSVRLSCDHREKILLKDVFNFLMTNPVEDDYLLLYPRLRSVRQQSKQIEIEVELAEAIQ